MYIFLPMICSIASETEATSTRRNCPISSLSDTGAGLVADCARTVSTRSVIAHIEVSTNNAIPALRQTFLSSRPISFLQSSYVLAQCNIVRCTCRSRRVQQQHSGHCFWGLIKVDIKRAIGDKCWFNHFLFFTTESPFS